MIADKDYREDLIQELNRSKFDIDSTEILQAFDDAFDEFNLLGKSYQLIKDLLGSPQEFINHYVNERLSVEKQDHVLIIPGLANLRKVKETLSNRPIKYLNENSILKTLILLIPVPILVLTLIFGNYIDYQNSDLFYYSTLNLVIWVLVYELLVFFYRTELVSQTHSHKIRLIYRSLFALAFIIYIYSPFDYKGSLKEILDNNPELEGNVIVGGPFDLILNIWIISFIGFEILLALRSIYTHNSDRYNTLKSNIFAKNLYIFTFLVIISLNLVIQQSTTLTNWGTLVALLVILSLQIVRKNKQAHTVIEKYSIPIITGISTVLEIINRDQLLELLRLKLALFIVIALTTYVQYNIMNTSIKPTISPINPNYYSSLDELVEKQQVYLSNHRVLGKITITLIFLIFLLFEIVNYVSNGLIDQSRNIWTYGILIYILMVFSLVEIPTLSSTNFTGQLQLVLKKNKYLLVFYLFITWGVFNRFANFYEQVNLSNNQFTIIDYNSTYISLLFNAFWVGLILVHYQNRLQTYSKDKVKSFLGVIVIVLLQLFFLLYYLFYIAFKGSDSEYFLASKNELFNGLMMYIGFQLILPLINTLINPKIQSNIPQVSVT